MALVKNVERRIWDVEQFAVVIRHADGRDMRGDRTGMPMYDKSKTAKGTTTVADWKFVRFAPQYPGLDVDVVDATGYFAPGNSLLSTVRESYDED